MSHIIEIYGDTNDGDYISQKHTCKLSDMLFEDNFLINKKVGDGELDEYLKSEELPYGDFAFCLGEALCQITTSHNWARCSDFDKQAQAYPTIEKFLKLAFDIDLVKLEDETELDFDCVREHMYEELSDLLPYGEFGIHTIDSIKIYPVTEVDVVFDRESWADWYNEETNEVILRSLTATPGYVRMPKGTTSVITDGRSQTKFFVVPSHNDAFGLVRVGSLMPSGRYSKMFVENSHLVKKVK